MTQRICRNGIWVCAVIVMFPSGVFGQTAPKTPWGDPDLQGTYTNKTITPLERPDAVGEKQFLTDEEVAEQEQARLDRNEELLLAEAERTVAGGNVGGYNNFWLDGGTRPTGRTSLIVDPPNGKIPQLTAGGAQRHAAHNESFPVEGPFDSWEDLELNDRCLVWSAGPPMFPSAYNNNFIILQSPGYVVIYAEMIHDTRIIPIDSGDHIAPSMRQWHGDSRGHWDGDTLVVETRNIRRTEANAAAVGGDQVLLRAANGRTDDTIVVTERFTRVDARTVNYEFTIDDPTQWSTSFSGEFPFTTFPVGELEFLFEYACHEGNYSMTNILAGEREKEKAQR